MVVANHKIHGNQQAVGFADGTSVVWHPNTKMLSHPCKPVETALRSQKSDGDAAAGRVLGQIVQALHSHKAWGLLINELPI